MGETWQTSGNIGKSRNWQQMCRDYLRSLEFGEYGYRSRWSTLQVFSGSGPKNHQPLAQNCNLMRPISTLFSRQVDKLQETVEKHCEDLLDWMVSPNLLYQNRPLLVFLRYPLECSLFFRKRDFTMVAARLQAEGLCRHALFGHVWINWRSWLVYGM